MATMFLTLALLGQAVTAPPVETGEWKLGGSTAKFAMEARGRATEPSGAVLSLRSTSSPGGATGTILATLPAKALRGRRVTLTGELLAETGNGGGLLIRADADPAVAIALENSLAAPVWPMLAGLKALLGDARLGTFEDPSGASPPWIAGDIVGVSPPETLKRLEAAPVAILTGPRTASSGEAVTIAFRGRPLTRSFGQPTAGLSTANSNLPLSDGAIIFLTTATMADRTGKRYGDRIDPDELVAAPVHPKDDGDPTLAAAVRWLKQSPSCSGTSR